MLVSILNPTVLNCRRHGSHSSIFRRNHAGWLRGKKRLLGLHRATALSQIPYNIEISIY